MTDPRLTELASSLEKLTAVERAAVLAEASIVTIRAVSSLEAVTLAYSQGRLDGLDAAIRARSS